MVHSWFPSSLLGSNTSRPPTSSSTSSMNPYTTVDRPQSSDSSSMSPYIASDVPQSPFKGLPSPDLAGVIARLKEKSTDELRNILVDKSAYNTFFNSLEQVKDQNNLRHELWEETLQLARQNLEKETRISELQNQSRIIRTTELAAAQERLNSLEKQKNDIMKSCSPASLLQNLQDAIDNSEEESESLHKKLLENDIDLATFLQKYKKLRVAYHRRSLIHLAAKTSGM